MPTKIARTSQAKYRKALWEILPEQGRWTQEQYLAITDHTRRLIEFIDGYLEFLPMPTDRHQSILFFLLNALHAFMAPRGGKVSFSGLRLQIREDKFREPDLLLVKDAADPRRQNRFWLGADFVVEVVSPDKPQRDLVDKRHDYAEGKVPEYWIVNPITERIIVLVLHGKKYRRLATLKRGGVARSATLDGFEVNVSDVFDAD